MADNEAKYILEEQDELENQVELEKQVEQPCSSCGRSSCACNLDKLIL